MNNPLKSKPVRGVAITAVVLALVAAGGLTLANTSQAADSRWVTATAATGDVTQTFTATGSIARKNTVDATFVADGTVNSVKVAVGDKVSAGDVLATVDTRALKLAVLEAETSVAQAELSLYNAKHPNSTSSTSSSSGKSSSTSSSTKSTAATAAKGMTTVSIDLKALQAAVAGVKTAVSDEATACDPIMAWVNSEISSSSTTSKSDKDDTTKDSGTSTAEPTATASASPTATATQLSAVTDPTEDQLKACATARAELIDANDALQTEMDTINKAAQGGGSGGSNTGGGSSGGGSSSTTKSVSASEVASAKASLLEAEQKLQVAKDDLADADLLAPISGTIGTVGLAKGDDSGAGSITIVGSGDAVVTIEVPLTTRGSLKLGEAATVTPAGALTGLTGKVTNISLLETSGTSGDSPTYSTTIAVSDPTGKLATGAKASVSIAVASVTGVVRVPVSALTPTGTGTGTVKVLASGSTTPTTTEVKTGAVGGGFIQITDGLTAGQVVVLADQTAAIPSNATRSRTSTRTSSSSSSSSSSAKASASATTQPSANPTK